MDLDWVDAVNTALGAMIAVGVAIVAGAATISLRWRVYAGAKQEHVSDPFPLPELVARRSELEAQEDRAAANALGMYHQRSKALQDSTVAYLVGASSALFVAFVGSILGVTISRDWEPFHFVSAGLDLTALLVVLGAFVRSSQRRTAWLRERAVAEFLRQWNSTDFLFFRPNAELEAAQQAFSARTRAELEAGPGDSMAAIGAFGRMRIEEIRTALNSAATISKMQIRYYLEARTARQARWLERSRQRIESQNDFRGKLMIYLFVAALCAAIAKLGATLVGAKTVLDWAVVILMVAIGVGTASTSAYVGQNIRSLGHRYRTQLRVMECWFDEYDDVVAFARTDRPITKTQQGRVARAVAAFEAIMIAELIDWISISEDDIMEIAPS